MSVKASSHSRIKTIKVVCDRCKQIVEGIRGEEFIAGFYDMTKWEEYRRENEQNVCDSCMFADLKYIERYGSCFQLKEALGLTRSLWSYLNQQVGQPIYNQDEFGQCVKILLLEQPFQVFNQVVVDLRESIEEGLSITGARLLQQKVGAVRDVDYKA